jgi:hypothetical protein
LNPDTILWLSGLVLEAAVVVLCIRGKLFRITPVFCAYLAWSIPNDILYRVLTGHFQDKQFQMYVGEMIVDSIFQFCVLVELEWAVLRPIRASLPKHSVVILAILVIGLGAVIWPLARWTLPPDIFPAGVFYFQLQQTIAALRVVFFLAIAGFSQLLSIGWRNRELQIATGLGFFSMCTLGISLIHTHQTVYIQIHPALIPNPNYHRLDQIGAASYICSLLYWVVSFAQQEQERQEFTPQMRSFLLAVAGAARGTRVALAESQIGTPPKAGKR